jgi:opacity protein-like surface antigen
VRKSELGAAPLLDPGGEIQATALMASVFYDFGTGPFRPYAGFGLGVANVELEAAFTPPLQTVAVADDETAFAIWRRCCRDSNSRPRGEGAPQRLCSTT